MQVNTEEETAMEYAIYATVGLLSGLCFYYLARYQIQVRSIYDTENKKEISIVEWLSLDTDERALYKEDNILGDNNNDIISNEEYLNLPNDAQKFYLKAEDVVEYEERVKDTHDHIFVKHDLFNHDPKMKNINPNNIYSQNGIAEAFIKFAYDNKLSFAPTEEELNQIMHPENELPF